MTEDYGCKVCGKHFSEEEDLKSHGDMDHPEFTEMYSKEDHEPLEVTDDGYFVSGDISTMSEDEIKKYKEEHPHGSGELPADEIDQQKDKPVQSHDDWKKDLDLMRDQYSTEDVNDCAICNSTEHPTSEHPVTAQEETDDSYKDMLTKKDTLSGLGDYKLEEHPDEGLAYQKGQEEGGADDPLKKVDSLSESYKYMSRDHRATLFESLKFTQGDSAILAGLEWNELTRPVKVEACEAYTKSQEQDIEGGEDPEKEENDVYQEFYNLEKNHSSPDFKKKSIECKKCNESFYNFNDRAVHFNEVHATEQEYELPDQCPLCNQLIQEPETLDWHMEQSHGAHVPSTFTQTGITGAMADTDFDSLESHKKANENELDLCPICQDGMKCENLMSHAPNWNTTNNWSTNGIEPPNANESYAKEESIYGSVIDDHFDEQYVMDQDGMYKCKHCGAWLDVHNIAGFSPEEVAKHHLETEHGLTESKANESRASDLRKEIKSVTDFINIASIENPMNMGYKEEELQRLKDELESLGGEELELTEGEGGHQDLDDTTEYPDDDYEWIDGKRVKKKKESTEEEDNGQKEVEDFVNTSVDDIFKEMPEQPQAEEETVSDTVADNTGKDDEERGDNSPDYAEEEEEEGWGINWGDPEETAKDIHDLGHPEKTEDVDDSDNTGDY